MPLTKITRDAFGNGYTITVEDGARWLVVPPSFFVE